MRPRRAFFISPIVPARSGNGLAMRMGMFAEALSRIADLDVIVVPVAGKSGEPAPLRSTYRIQTHLLDIEGQQDTHFSLLSRISDERTRLDAFRAYGRPSIARGLSTPVTAQIARLVEARRPDIIHFGRSYLLPCVESLPQGIAMTLDLDEDDRASFASQARLALVRGDVSRAAWLEQEGVACDALIAGTRDRFVRTFIAAAADAPPLARRHPGLACEAIENPIEIPRRRAKRDDGRTLLFVGTLGYAPNSDGIAWFFREVMPKLRPRSGGDCRLLIAGALAPLAVAALARHPCVTVLGWVTDLVPLYQRATLALGPIRAGGGTRIKLLEAAAHRTASVSTPVAAAGIHWPGDAGGWRAATPGAFAEACRRGLADDMERDRRAADGLKWVLRHHARERLVARLARTLAAAADHAPTRAVTDWEL
jgi:glycosyltransferase involved in cell wall biosynthesis